jgi:hypothetical protein
LVGPPGRLERHSDSFHGGLILKGQLQKGFTVDLLEAEVHLVLLFHRLIHGGLCGPNLPLELPTRSLRTDL